MKKRNVVAGIFMGAAIAVSIPIGINRSLGRLRDDMSGSFYYDKAGYSICDGLEERRAAAKDLLTLAGRYSDSSPELAELIDELDYQVRLSENTWSGDGTFLSEAAANSALDAPAEELAAALNRAGLSEKDKKYPDQLILQMRSEQDKINRSSYNDDAIEFNRKVDRLWPMAMVSRMAVFHGNTSSVEEAKAGTSDRTELQDAAEQWADGFGSAVEEGVDGFVDGMSGMIDSMFD